MAKTGSSKWKMILTVATLVALGILILLSRDKIGDVVTNLGRVNTFALLLLVPLQIVNYHAYSRLYQRIFAIIHGHVRYRHMYRLSLELNFVNHILPSGGVSGISYFGLRMRSLGVSASKATLAQVMKFGLIFISFQALIFFGLFSLAIMGRANNLTILVGATIATLVLVGTLIGIYILDSRQRVNDTMMSVTKLLNWLIHRFRPSHPETINLAKANDGINELHESFHVIKKNWRELKAPLLYAFVANLTEVLSVYVVFVAFGELVNIGAVIMAYAVANFAGLISVLPGGIGVYEALMTTVMATAGVPAALSIPVVIMYRVLNMGIQLIPGYYFYHRALNENGFESHVRKKRE